MYGFNWSGFGKKMKVFLRSDMWEKRVFWTPSNLIDCLCSQIIFLRLWLVSQRLRLPWSLHGIEYMPSWYAVTLLLRFEIWVRFSYFYLSLSLPFHFFLLEPTTLYISLFPIEIQSPMLVKSLIKLDSLEDAQPCPSAQMVTVKNNNPYHHQL